MFYIAATICFLHIQTFAMPVCFEYAAIPYKFGKKAECDLKRDQLIDNGQLSWYRYPGFSYTQPNYWYIVNGIEEPFAVHMSYVDYQLSEIKLISSNNYENTEALRDIYVGKYGLDYNQEASGLGFSYTWLVDKLKVTISRRNKGRGDCVIHYSINPLQIDNSFDGLSGIRINIDKI